MDYHLENEVLLSEKSKYKSLYSWSLQEFNKEGRQIGADQIPWEWSLYFTASELRHDHSININRCKKAIEKTVELTQMWYTETVYYLFNFLIKSLLIDSLIAQTHTSNYE